MLMECKSVALWLMDPRLLESMCGPVTLSSISPSNASHAVSVGFLPGAWPGSDEENDGRLHRSLEPKRVVINLSCGVCDIRSLQLILSCRARQEKGM